MSPQSALLLFLISLSFVIVSVVYLPKVSSNEGLVRELKTQNDLLTTRLASVESALGTMFMHSGQLNETLIESGTFDWSFQSQFFSTDLIVTANYTLKNATDGFLTFYVLTVQPPVPSYTLPGPSPVLFSVTLTNFPTDSLMPSVNLILSQQNQARLQLPCYNDGSCFIGNTGGLKNIIQANYKLTPDFSLNINPTGSFDWSLLVGQTFALSEPWEFIVLLN